MRSHSPLVHGCAAWFAGLVLLGTSSVAWAEGKHLVVTIPPLFEDAGDFSEGLAPAREGGTWGFVDTSGNWKIRPAFESVGPFRNGLARVKKDGRFGFVDKRGAFAIPLGYSDARDFAEGLAAVQKGKTWGFVDAKGKEAIPTSLADVGNFADGLAPVKKGNAWGYIDKAGNEVIAPKYKRAADFSEGLAAVQDAQSDLYGFIDTKGQAVIAPQYGSAFSFAGGRAVVSKEADPTAGDGSLRGLARKILINTALFNGTCPTNVEWARETSPRRFGAIDREGKEVIAMTHDYLQAHPGGFVVRKFGTGDGLLGPAGAEVVAPKWSSVAPPAGGYVAFLENAKVGYATTDGQVVLPPTYDWPTSKALGGIAGEDADYLHQNVGQFVNGFAWYSSAGKYGWLRPSDKPLTPAEEAKFKARTDAAAKAAEAAKKAAEAKAQREREAAERKAAAARAVEEKRLAAERAQRRARYDKLPKYLRTQYDCSLEDVYAAAQNGLDCQQLQCVGDCLVAKGRGRTIEFDLNRGGDMNSYQMQATRCESECKSSDARAWREDNIEGYPGVVCRHPYSGEWLCP
jgi:hypothetical protein